MKWTQIAVLLSIVGLGSSQAGATMIGVDYMRVYDSGGLIFADEFDNGVFDTPVPWYVGRGSPGPESGSTLILNNQDIIVAAIYPTSGSPVSLSAHFDLTEFPLGAAAAIVLGGEGQDKITLVVGSPGIVSMGDESSALGALDLGAIQSVDLTLVWNGDGTVKGIANGLTIYEGENSLTTPQGIAALVVPEPVSVGLMVVGSLGYAVSRRRK